MQKLTITSLDANLLAMLARDVQKLLAAYEKTSTQGATKRSAMLAANTVKIERV